MLVTIKLFAALRKGRFEAATVEYREGTTVEEIIQELGIPQDEITLIFINGRHSNASAIVREGDTIAFFPAAGGG